MTGGDAGPALDGLADAYEHPDVYDALPYRHNYTPNGDYQITAYFIPAYTIVTQEGMFDKRGWTDPEKGKAFYNKIRDQKAKDPQALVIYCAEFCFTADEALALEGTNKFNKVLIANQIANIRIHNTAPAIETGVLDYDSTDWCKANPMKVSYKDMTWIKNKAGKIHILEHPIWTIQRKDENGNPLPTPNELRNMYVAGIDSIDIGMQDTSAMTDSPSDFCIVIKKRARGLEEPQYVAYYKDRPNDIREAYKTAIKLLQYYNCQAVIEATRMSMITWARGNGTLPFFMKRPRATLSDVQRGKSNTYGAPATAAVIDHQTDLIADFVEDYCHTIWFPEMLQELNQYTDEKKTKFDMIAAMGMAELADEELQGRVPKEIEPQAEVVQKLGFYYDEYGRKRYGLIPIENNYSGEYNISDPNIEYDYSMSRSSDPRRR